jgi:hypothetical protein
VNITTDIESQIFNNINLRLGSAQITKDDKMTESQFSVTKIDIQDEGQKLQEFEFLVFMPERSVQGQMDILRDGLITKLFSVWAGYFSVAAVAFCILSAVIVWCISVKITEPIL